MITEQGDGEMQKRIEAGLCPKCFSQLIEKPDGYDCTICGLEIKEEKNYRNGKKDVV